MEWVAEHPEERPFADAVSELVKREVTLKTMIRALHIAEPAFTVMAILGKRYPASKAEFVQSKLSGTFDPERAGKRMRLPVPETVRSVFHCVLPW